MNQQKKLIHFCKILMLEKNTFKIISLNKAFVSILFFLSLLANQYYGYRGVFPIDSFLIFDAAYNITSGHYPFKDYWTITGPLLDYIQALFFLMLGINWFSYVLHASILNMILTLFSFYFFLNIGLKNYYAFIYSLGVLILTYPSAGTPFVDHHAVIFSVMGLYSLALGILLNKNLFWFLIPVFIVFSFLSKQIPAPYLSILFTFVIFYYFFLSKDLYKKILLYLIAGCLFAFLIIISIFLINEIPIKNFLIQYVFYPMSLGEGRIHALNNALIHEFKLLKGIVLYFKFIFLVLIPLLISTFFLLKIKVKDLVQKKELIVIFLFLGSILIFIYCQLLTQNQVLIFFLIPICAAFSHSYIIKYYNKNYLIYLILLIFVFSTTKYHLSFNQQKNFMDLTNANFELSVDAGQLDKRLSGLKWISPNYKDNPSYEIDLLISTKKILSKKKENFFFITDYQFFASLLKNQFVSPNKWYDIRSVPRKKNKYFKEYKNFFLSKVKNNKIKYIYLIGKNKEIFFYKLIDDNSCIISKQLNELLIELQINKCEF